MSRETEKADVSTRRGRRVWGMRLAAVFLSLSPLLLLEVVLRISRPDTIEALDQDPLVDLHQLTPLFELNEELGRWEIPVGRHNFFRPDSFLAEKATGARRIFVLGGSTVQGRPYAIETAFSTWLRLQLQAACPDTEFEVINCGGVSYASYRVSKILNEVLEHQPDAIVLYTGHNEFLEHREYAEVRELGPVRRWVTKWGSRLQTVKWLQSYREVATNATILSNEVDAKLDHAGGLDRYVRDSAWRAGVEAHFAETLESMIGMTQAADVPLILCVPAGDLVETPPFKVQSLQTLAPNPRTRFDDAWDKTQDASLSTTQRKQACEECLEIDPDHAGALYFLGRLGFDENDPAARRQLVAARDEDVCPLRATTPIVDAVRQLAESQHVMLVETDVLFDQRNHDGSPIHDGICDPEFFVDHVHPSIAGHQAIGASIFQEIVRLGWCEPSPDQARRYQQLAEQQLASLGEEYFARGRQRLQGLKRWAAGRAAESLESDQR